MFKIFSLQGERRRRVYPNAKHMVTLQTGSSGRYNGPDRWAPRPTVQSEAPWNAMKSKSQNKASFPATCRTTSPSLCLCLRSFRSPPRVVTKEIHEDHGGMSQIFCNRLCRCKPGSILSFLRQESFHIQTHKLLLRIPQYFPDWEDGDPWWITVGPHSYSYFSNTMDLPTLCVCICVCVCLGVFPYKVKYFLELKHHEDICSKARRGSFF